MRIAILSDIHGNLEGLRKALEIVHEKQIDEIVCLGDTVGYGANPNECLELLRQNTTFILMGNHDQAAIDISVTEDFTQHARSSAEWTARTVTPENKEWIKNLPYTLERSGLLFVHASPFEPHEWHYILTPSDAQQGFQHFRQPICFVGHSHVAGMFCDDIWTRQVTQGKRFIVNVGSVGQPRDRNPKLSFGIFDTEKWEYENVRSDYDVQTASEKIRKAGLPTPLAERILEGR
jgi:putative phosphoesterase